MPIYPLCETTIVNLDTGPFSSMVDNGNGTATHTSGDGLTTIVSTDQLAAAIFDPVTSELSLTMESGTLFAIDLSACCAGGGTAGDTVQSVTYNQGTGEFELTTDLNTFIVAIPPGDTSTLTDNNDGTITHVAGGVTTTFDTRFGFTQTIGAGTASVDISHLKNSAPVNYQILNSVTGAQIFPASAISLDLDTLRLTFTPALASSAIVNIL